MSVSLKSFSATFPLALASSNQHNMTMATERLFFLNFFSSSLSLVFCFFVVFLPVSVGVSEHNQIKQNHLHLVFSLFFCLFCFNQQNSSFCFVLVHCCLQIKRLLLTGANFPQGGGGRGQFQLIINRIRGRNKQSHTIMVNKNFRTWKCV